MLKVVFMGTPEFAVPALKRIHGEHEILAVYTQPDRPVGRGLEVRQSAVKAQALSLRLPVRQPEKLTAPGEYEALLALKPEVIVVVDTRVDAKAAADAGVRTETFVGSDNY